MSRGNKLVGMRLDPPTISLLDQLAGIMSLSRGQLVAYSLRLLAGHHRIATDATQAPAQLPGQLTVEDLQQAQKAMP